MISGFPKTPELIRGGFPATKPRDRRFFLSFVPLLLICSLLSAQPADRIVATVGAQVIAESDLDKYVLEARLRQPSLWGVPRAELRAEVLQSAIEELLLEAAFFELANSLPDDQVDRFADRMWDSYLQWAGSESDLKRALEEMNLDEQELRRDLVKRARRVWAIESSLVTEVEPALFNRSDDKPANAERVLLGQILIEPENPRNPESWTAAEKHALEIWIEIDGGMPFEKAAQTYSDDRATARQGGDIGWIRPGVLDPALRECIANLGKGEVSRPTRTESGVHLLVVHDFLTSARLEIERQAAETRLRHLGRMLDRVEVSVASDYPKPDFSKVPEPTVPDPWERLAPPPKSGNIR